MSEKKAKRVRLLLRGQDYRHLSGTTVIQHEHPVTGMITVERVGWRRDYKRLKRGYANLSPRHRWLLSKRITSENREKLIDLLKVSAQLSHIPRMVGQRK